MVCSISAQSSISQSSQSAASVFILACFLTLTACGASNENQGSDSGPDVNRDGGDDPGVDAGPPPYTPPGESEICTDQGLCWEYPRPHGATVTDSWTLAPDHSWATALIRGAVLHFDGASWTALSTGAEVEFTTVTGTDPGHVFAAGETTVLRWNGFEWLDLSFPGTTAITDSYAAAPGDLWVLAAAYQDASPPFYRSELWRHRDGYWSMEQEWAESWPAGAVHGSGPDDVWVAGPQNSVSHFDGGVWQSQVTTQNGGWNSIWVVGPNDVWTAGTNTGSFSYGQVGHFDGTTWEASAAPYGDVHAIRRASDGRIWIAGESGLAGFHDGEGWRPRDVPGNQGSYDFQAIIDLGNDEVMLLGRHGIAYRHDGENITEIVPGNRTAFESAWELPDGTAWAVGEEGKSVHFDGTQWQEVDTNTSTNLLAVWGSGPDQVFAVGENGLILKHDGASWQEEDVDVNVTLGGVAGTASNDVWAVGTAGHTLHFDGQQWSVVTNGGPSAFDVYALPDGTFLLGSASSGVERWTGETWTDLGDIPTFKPIRDLWGTSLQNVWAVGDDPGGYPTAYHYNGSTWQALALGTARVRAVWGTVDGVWTAQYDRIVQLSPARKTIAEGTGFDVGAIAGDAPFFATRNGGILRYRSQ